MVTIKQRNYFFDNLKALLIFLVVLGHILELLLKSPGCQFFHNVIYSFHMPAFVFVAGYFSKNIEKQSNSIVFDFLIPYIGFNSLYQIILNKTLLINVFTPIYAYWFLLSMFLWKVFLKNLIQIRFVFFSSIILSLYCGIFDDVSRYLSASRTFVFLPYFLAGYFCNEQAIAKIKKMPKGIDVSIFFLSLCGVIYLFNFMMVSSEVLKGADSYNILGLSSLLNGFLIRIILFFIGASFIVSLINLIPERQLKVTYIGKRTLFIYLFHPFLIILVGEFCRKLMLFNEFYGIIVCLFVAIVITGLLGVSVLTEFYGYLISLVYKIFKKEYLNNTAL